MTLIDSHVSHRPFVHRSDSHTRNVDPTDPSQLRGAERIGISVLSEHNRDVINNFYRPSHQRFESLDYFTDGEAILFPDASLHISAEFVDEITVGDHAMAILRAVSLRYFAGRDLDRPRPLVFHQSVVTTSAV